MAIEKPLKRLTRSLWHAYLRWAKCDCVDLSAAFAYYTLQSIFPILLISLSVASWFLGRQDDLERQINISDCFAFVYFSVLWSVAIPKDIGLDIQRVWRFAFCDCLVPLGLAIGAPVCAASRQLDPFDGLPAPWAWLSSSSINSGLSTVISIDALKISEVAKSGSTSSNTQL